MFPDLSKAADALTEARDLMHTLIKEIQGLRAEVREVKDAIERKENASL